MRLWSPTLRLKTRVMIALTALIGATALAIIGYTDVRHRGSSLELARELINASADLVIERTVSFLAPAQRATAVLADALSNPAVELDRATTLSLLSSLVAVEPQIDSAFVADNHGGLLQLRRGLPEAGLGRDALVLRRVHRQGGAASESFRALIAGVPPRLGPPLVERIWDYDPRGRPWFEAAINADGRVWTQPYVFSTTHAPGVTAVQALRGPTGALRGVVGADLTLSLLSDFLREQRLGLAGLTFLVGQNDRVLAHPNPNLYAQTGRSELPGLDEIGVPGLAEALARFREGGDDTATLTVDGRELLVRFRDLPEAQGVRWTLVILASTQDFLGGARETRRNAVLISLLILALAVSVSGVVAGDLARPLESLARKVARVRTLAFDNDFNVASRVLEVRRMSEALVSMQAALQSFARYAPAGLVQRLMASGEVARLGGELRDVSILFADIRGYSTLTERLTATDVVELLNLYFSVMQEVIEAHQGEVLEYMGDGILVVFGAPIDLPEHPRHAVQCALAMTAALQGLNAAWEADGTAEKWKAAGVSSIRSGIGIHAGPVVAGNLGSRTHMKYGVVGDTVNVAARLEVLNKELDTSILISDHLRTLLPRDLRARTQTQGTFTLKGRGQGTLVHSVR